MLMMTKNDPGRHNHWKVHLTINKNTIDQIVLVKGRKSLPTFYNSRTCKSFQWKVDQSITGSLTEIQYLDFYKCEKSIYVQNSSTIKSTVEWKSRKPWNL